MAGTQPKSSANASAASSLDDRSAVAVANAYTSPELAIVALQDPRRIKLFATQVADQINGSRMAANPPMRCENLSEHIQDIIIGTTAQGASTLEVHVIDPAWTLLQRDTAGQAFIDVDPDGSGYLWPPIAINFPQGTSDAMWRLCSVQATIDLEDANLILTFEDQAVAELRTYSGPVVSKPNETRAEFIERLIDTVRIGTTSEKPIPVNGTSYSPIVGQPDGSIRFVALLDPSTFTPSDLTSSERTKTLSSKTSGSPARQNPDKNAGRAAVNATQRVATQVISITTGLPGNDSPAGLVDGAGTVVNGSINSGVGAILGATD